jgi:hypothetical protein
MFNDNMSMGGGPEGKWMNRNTGESLYVMNSVMDGESMVLITDHGELSGEDIEYFMNNYVKADDDQTEYKVTDGETGAVAKMTDSDKKNAPKQKSKLAQHDEDFYIDDIPVNNIQINNNTTKKEIKNENIIKKLFDKIDSKPKIIVTVDWADFPKNELSTLINFLDVDINDISKYIEQEFITTDEISGEINKIILSKLDD